MCIGDGALPAFPGPVWGLPPALPGDLLARSVGLLFVSICSVLRCFAAALATRAAWCRDFSAPALPAVQFLLWRDCSFLYDEGESPTCSLKYLPRNDWLGKCMSVAISLMLFDEFLSLSLSSSVT